MRQAYVCILAASTLLAITLGACGKKVDPAADATNTPPSDVTQEPGDASTTGDDSAGAGAGATDAGPGAEEVDDESAHRQKVLERLAALEVEGFQRMRGQVQGGFVTLQHATKTPNAKGNTLIIEVTAGFCEGCKQEDKAALEARKDQVLAQYGELHAKNPGLVFDIAELELLPERTAIATYVRSFVDDGETRAAMHGLEATFIDSMASVRLFAYPQSPFPQTAAEHDEAVSRKEIEDAMKALFAGISPVLWSQR